MPDAPMSPPASSSETPLLALDGISKAYPAVVANDAVSLDIRPGRIHAILGENGAGKSTLMKIIYGVTQPDAGVIRWKGEPVSIRSPAHARSLGIGMVFQHFSLFETLTVAQNVSLAMRGSARSLAPRIREIGERLSLEVDPAAPVHALSMGERQRVEIIRCLLQNPDLIIMDEPTSVLPPALIPALFETLQRLAEEGRSILFISHKLEEIRSLCHDATVMRAGRVVASLDPTTVPADELARLMVGRTPAPVTREANAAKGAPLIEIDDLDLPAVDAFGRSLHGVSLQVRPGEIVGIAGVSGNGQAELVRVLSGETRLPRDRAARVRLCETGVGRLGPRERRGLGLGFVPEDRLGRGAVPDLSLAMNGLLTGSDTRLVGAGMIRFGRVAAFARTIIETFDVRSRGPEASARSLSGGNLQKFIVGREIEFAPKALIVSQPNWGVDVGAAAAIRRRLLDISAEGTAILVVSDDLEELLEISDRLHVMFRGRLSRSVDPHRITPDAIGLAMTGSFAALDAPSEAGEQARA